MEKYKIALYSIIISSIAIPTFSIPSSHAATKTQLFKPSKAGRVSTVVANTILHGVTPPKIADGIDGDFYIDTKAMLFYGPKTKSHWSSPTSLRGPQGQPGANGSNGTGAKPIANVVAVGAQGLTGATGPKGEQGAQGIQGMAGSAGSKGEAGAPGSAGANGLPGANGSAGSSGAQGAQGVQGPPGVPGGQGANGAVGAQGSQGPQGTAGVTGAIGAAGATGAVGPSGSTGVAGTPGAIGPSGPTGAVGPSSAIYGSVSFGSPIQGVVGTAQTSSNFGTFEAGKSYLVRIQIQTFNTSQLITAYPLAIELSVLGATPSRFVSYIVSNGTSFNLSTLRDEVSIAAEVILDGSQVANSYALSITVTCGANTSSFPVTLIGKYHAVLVGQVTQTS